ncbi:hypothetical protein F5Y15DRAFT_417341 [Xylariaceae sp. FL0016]|nr:hypothetical protein F5Y15DRAFT_417341 [Xylariaceae sp. FL0016]
MSGLPPGTLGDAIGVLFYTFVCLLSDIILIWLLWVHREPLSYVALMAYFTATCVISSIIQQIYHYLYYTDILWAQLDYIKANYPSAEVVFKSGNFGLMLVLSNIRFACYILESSYLFTYILHVALSVYGVWTVHPHAERSYATLSKMIPLLLTGISIGLEYTPPVQHSWTAYMVVANLQAVASCTFSILLIIMILWKYIDTKKIWNRVTTRMLTNETNGSSRSWTSWILMKGRNKHPGCISAGSSRLQAQVPRAIFDNNWLVIRLSIAIVFITAFILATVLVHLPAPAQFAEKVESDTPDLSPTTARSSIIGYIYGVSPGLAIPIVFGLTRPFRQTMYRRFVPSCWKTRHQRHRGVRGQSPEPPGQARGTSDPHASVPRQNQRLDGDRFLPLEVDLDSFELSLGSMWNAPPSIADESGTGTRLADSGSTTSLNPLLT